MSSIDMRPSIFTCGASGLSAPDEDTEGIHFPANESDADLQIALRYLPRGWVYLRAYRVEYDPDCEIADAQVDRQIEHIRAAGPAQGATTEQIEEAVDVLEASRVSPRYRIERVHSLLSDAQIERLTDVGLEFDDEDGDDDEDGEL